MKIQIEELSKEFKNDVVRIGGAWEDYEELDECFRAKFYHHELATEEDVVVITDELTGYELIIKRCDFYTIELI